MYMTKVIVTVRGIALQIFRKLLNRINITITEKHRQVEM